MNDLTLDRFSVSDEHVNVVLLDQGVGHLTDKVQMQGFDVGRPKIWQVGDIFRGKTKKFDIEFNVLIYNLLNLEHSCRAVPIRRARGAPAPGAVV